MNLFFLVRHCVFLPFLSKGVARAKSGAQSMPTKRLRKDTAKTA